MAKTGRPKTDNPKTKCISMRLTATQRDEIKGYSERHGQTITQTIMDAFRLLVSKEEESAMLNG